jgi:hypothetical protein
LSTPGACPSARPTRGSRGPWHYCPFTRPLCPLQARSESPCSGRAGGSAGHDWNDSTTPCERCLGLAGAPFLPIGGCYALPHPQARERQQEGQLHQARERALARARERGRPSTRSHTRSNACQTNYRSSRGIYNPYSFIRRGEQRTGHRSCAKPPPNKLSCSTAIAVQVRRAL